MSKKMKEGDIEHWSVSKARRANYWVRKFTSPARRSAPDDIFAQNGRVFFVEFKATGKKPSDLQEHEHKLMREAGLTVYVCDSRELFDEILEAESFWN